MITMLKVGNILTVNDNKYTVATSVIKDGNEYVYLVDLSNPDNTVICFRKNDDLKIINNIDLIEELESMFSENM